jgi:hypothetical protein
MWLECVRPHALAPHRCCNNASSPRWPVGRASEEEPQYLIKSEKTDHQAMSRANREVLPCGPKTHCKT